MEPLAKYDRNTILGEDVFIEIFDQEDEIMKARLILSLTDRAAELGVKGKFEELLRAYKKVDRENKRREREKPVAMLERWTNFDGPYENMFCGAWLACEDGVYAQNDSQIDAVACYHPILPIERMKNLETGEEQIKIAYKRNGTWNEIIVPKTMVTSASKIVSLSGRGISVTSENAKLLVRYLSDVENMNDSHIKVQYSTSKLGWISGQFIPYDTEYRSKAMEVIDKNNRYKSILYTTGDELVEVVFEILQEMLGCDLSEFTDKKKEDFKFTLGDKVFIGEIKGVTPNVKKANVSQLDVHVQEYMDENDEQAENIIALLIINHQRGKAISERERVHEEVIKLAERNGSLIVDTMVLLKLFEQYTLKEKSREECIELLENNTGLLEI